MAHLYDPNHGGEFHLVGAAVKHTSRQSSEACPRAHCTNEDTDASSILLAAWTGAFLLVAFIIPCSRYLSHRVTKIPAVSFAFWLILIVLTFIFRGSAILNTTIFTNAILRGYRIVSVAIIGCVGMVAYTIYLFTDKRKLLNGLIMVNQLRDCEDEHIKSSQGDTISATANNEKLAHEIGKRYPHFHSHQNVLSIEHEQTNAVAERNSREADEGYLINIIAWLTIPLAVADSVFIFLPILLNSTGSCNSTSVTTTAAPHTAAPGHHERSVNHSEVPHSVHPTSAEVHATTAPSDLCIRNLPLFYAGAIIFTVQKLIQAGMIRYRMRGHQPIESRRLQAILFLKLMAVWNLFEWLDSLLEIHANLQRRRIDFAIHNAASLFVVVYDALVVDYRLLCATVFYEKAMGLEKIHQATDDLSNCYTHRRRGRPFQGLENWCRLLAFSLGPLTAVIPILKILNISGNYFALPAIANDTILTISLDAVGIMCIAIVLFLLWYNKLEIDTEEHEYTQILIFVMGWVGLLFWGLYGGAALILYNDKNYESMESKLYYSGVKSIIHVISLFLQMGFFIHVPTNFYHYRRVVWFNFLFIFMTWLFISQFIAEIVDQETVSLDHVFQSSCKIPSSLSIFFQVAHPLMVGFRFHVCLHTSQAAMAIKFDTVKISRVKANSFHDITVKAMQKGKTVSLSKIDDSTPVAVGLNLKDSDLDTEMKGSDRTYSVRSNSVQGGSLRGGSIRSSSIIINDVPLQEEVFAPSSRV